VDGRGIGETALVLGECARVEERRAARAPAADFRAQIEEGIGADQPLRQRGGLSQEEPVVVALRELHRRALVHRERGRDVEQHERAHGLRVIER
jgi:hypothetical protein